MNSFGYILDLHLNAWDGRVKPQHHLHENETQHLSLDYSGISSKHDNYNGVDKNFPHFVHKYI
jgi:hypothetical protein